MNVDFADEEMIAYRESLIEKKKEQPFWKKKCLSVNETAAYTGIGRGKIRELMKRKDCNFMTTDGYQVYVMSKPTRSLTPTIISGAEPESVTS